MAKRKARTDAQKDRAKDIRLQRKYGITLAQQNERREQQGNCCKICRVEFTAENPPNTDHFHFKVTARKLGPKNWAADGCMETLLSAMTIAGYPTKAAAVRAMKYLMAPRSIRGLLCRKCNRGLGYIERFFDGARHPERLAPVVDYYRARLEKSLTV